MISLRQIVLSILPAPVHSILQPLWRRIFRLKLRARDWWVPFMLWVDAIRSLTGKLTIVVAAHRLSAVANCDQLIDRLMKSLPSQ